MGARRWSYSTPYDEDIEAALGRLQREVFERGEYYKPWEETWRYRDEILAKPPDELEDHERQYLDHLDTFGMPDRGYVPASIRELLESNAD